MSGAAQREALLRSWMVVPWWWGTCPDAPGQRPHPWSVDAWSPLWAA